MSKTMEGMNRSFAPQCPADRHCLWSRHCHLEHSGRHSGLEHQSQPHTAPHVHVQQHAHENLPLSLPQRLPDCLLPTF